MKTFSQYIKEATPPTPCEINKTPQTVKTMRRFGSASTLGKRAKLNTGKRASIVASPK